jgi:hypothetical protein
MQGYTYEELQNTITNFILDLCLMCNALQELSGLILDFQEHDIDL